MWTTETLVSYQKDNRKATQKVTSLRHMNTLLPSIFLSTMLTFRSFLKKYLLTIIYFIPRPYSSDSPKDASQVFWHWTFFFGGCGGGVKGLRGSNKHLNRALWAACQVCNTVLQAKKPSWHKNVTITCSHVSAMYLDVV